jgi:hypothetical protein
MDREGLFMNKVKDDNMTFGTLLLGIGVILVAIWALKFVLTTLLDVTQTILTVGFYAILIYMALTLILSIYAKMYPQKTPKLIKALLSFHHMIAVMLKYSFRAVRRVFRKKKPSRS